jgi:hypothetical protein
VLVFQKVWRLEQNFVLAQKVSPQSSPDRRALPQAVIELLWIFA